MFKRCLKAGIWVLLMAVGAGAGAQQETDDSRPEAQSEIEKGPVISQFRENWILGELRSLRQDMMEYRNDMNRIVTDRELEVADKAMGYLYSGRDQGEFELRQAAFSDSPFADSMTDIANELYVGKE